MTAFDSLPDESILFLYDTFGANFWVRVLENTEKHPLQLDVRFHGLAVDGEFQLQKGELERGKQLFEILGKLLSSDMYKHTPFFDESRVTNLRFSFDPGLIRFNFRPDAMPALHHMAQKGVYLSSLRDITKLLKDDQSQEALFELLEIINIDLTDQLKAAYNAIRDYADGKGDKEKVSGALSALLGGANTPHGVKSAMALVKRLVAEDQVFGVQNEIGINRLQDLNLYADTVVAYIERKELLAAKLRAELHKPVTDHNQF